MPKNAPPKVSIGVVTYNHREFITQCLDSIRLQDYPNVEVIVSDDASTDDTCAVVRAYMQKHPGFIKQFHAHKKNLGIARHCNFVLEKLNGDYVQTFAGDDTMLPGKIAAQVSALQANPQASLCFTNTEWFWSESGRKICNHFGLLQRPSTNLADIIADCTVPTPSILINGKWLGNTRYKPQLKYVNDFYFIVELMLKAPPIYLPMVTVRYRKHKGGITLQHYFYEDRIRLLEMFRRTLPPQYAPSIRRYGHIAQYAKIMTLLQAGKKREALKAIPSILPVVLTSPKWAVRFGAIMIGFMKATRV